MGFEMNKGQLVACMDLEHWWHHSTKQVFGIEGPAGSGKTTIIHKFIEQIGLPLEDVLFVAYMGKAASQMIRNKLPAKTIHASIYNFEKTVEVDDHGKVVLNEAGNPKMKLERILKDKIPGKPKLIVVDESVMVPEQNALDLLSFGIPVIALGDNNQLPPVFGKSFFLKEPDVALWEIMRQKENDPIVLLAQKVLNGEPLRPCIMGKSSIIEKKYLTKRQLVENDVIITGSNKLRASINRLFREEILAIDNPEYPNFNEKIICRKNNWGKRIKENGSIYLTNGLSGFVEGINKSSFNGASIRLDFRPDFARRTFNDVKISLPYINTDPGQNKEMFVPIDTNSFEYAYAITAQLSQGSQYPKVMVLQEDHLKRNQEYFRRLMYTAITRAMDSVQIIV